VELPGLSAETDLKSVDPIVFIGGATPRVIVGGNNGLYTTETSGAVKWFKLRGELPNSMVKTLGYSKLDDKLILGAMGRSVWSVSSASKL
jgi:hypothetical protein